MAENLSEEELKGLKQMFKNIDTDRSGAITFEELKTGLSRLGSRLSEHEIKQLMDAVRRGEKTLSDSDPFLLSLVEFVHCIAFWLLHEKFCCISTLVRLMLTGTGRSIMASLLLRRCIDIG